MRLQHRHSRSARDQTTRHRRNPLSHMSRSSSICRIRTLCIYRCVLRVCHLAAGKGRVGHDRLHQAGSEDILDLLVLAVDERGVGEGGWVACISTGCICRLPNDRLSRGLLIFHRGGSSGLVILIVEIGSRSRASSGGQGATG